MPKRTRDIVLAGAICVLSACAGGAAGESAAATSSGPDRDAPRAGVVATKVVDARVSCAPDEVPVSYGGGPPLCVKRCHADADCPSQDCSTLVDDQTRVCAAFPDDTRCRTICPLDQRCYPGERPFKCNPICMMDLECAPGTSCKRARGYENKVCLADESCLLDCPKGWTCRGTSCACATTCFGPNACGPDGCGGTCGPCTGKCVNGQCKQ